MRRALATLCFALFCLTGSQAGAHGIWGHMHVTGWAVENMPDGELEDFFSEPEVFEALLYGAAFTDAGYWIRSGPAQDTARAFAEHNHWPPFIHSALDWIRANDPPPWDSLESRKRAAFIMGIAAHGLQDEIFDSLFLYQIDEHDDAGQDEADGGTDGFLFLDDHVRLRPAEYIPMDMLLELYATLDRDIGPDDIESATGAMGAYLGEQFGRSIAESLGRQAESTIPWAREHYLDPNIPGSLRSEIEPTRHHLEAVWDRLHGRWTPADLVVHTYPATPRRLLSHRHDSPDAWVTFVFGKGIAYGEGTAALTDQAGATIPATRDDTRWGGPGDWTRLATIKPSADLTPGALYTASLTGSATAIDQRSVPLDYTFEFQVECAQPNPQACPELDLQPPSITGEAPPEADAGAATSDPGATSDATDGGCQATYAEPSWTLLWLLTAFLAARASVLGRRPST